MRAQRELISESINSLTHNLTTSIGEVVEVLGQISESMDRLSGIVQSVDNFKEFLEEMEVKK